MIKLELTPNEAKGLTNEELEIAKARKLELLILPHLRRNINFFYAGANIPKKAKAYHQPLDKNVLENSLQTGQTGISTACKPLCEMVAGILRENGLNADTVSCDTDMFRHTDVLFTTSSGKKYIINYLEDIESIQTGMSTPDFASKEYYERRYKKFEHGLTTDSKSLEGIDFIERDRLSVIDNNLGYKKYNMYMDIVTDTIRNEFRDFRNIMAENEYLTESMKPGEKRIKEEIYEKWNSMSDDEILEKKLDWIFDYFNDRMDLTRTYRFCYVL